MAGCYRRKGGQRISTISGEQLLARSPQAWPATPSPCYKPAAVRPRALFHLPLLLPPSLRLCPVHGAPAQLLCSILPARGRTGERRQQPPAKVKASKEGSVSSIRSSQSADCCCNPSALGLLHCSASTLEAATQAGPHSPCLHGAASLQPPGRRGEEEAADDRNLPELFRAQLFAMLVAINCFSVFWERGL